MARDRHTVDMFAPPPAPRRAKLGPEHDGLRYFQLEAHHAIMASLEANRSTLLVLATGLGKTQCFSSIAKHWPGRVLVLAHRDELVGQAVARLEEMTGELVEVEQGPLRSSRARIVVGSVQTVQRKDRLESLAKRGGFTLIIADECFPAGTLVDGKPIETVGPGDMVSSVDHRTGQVVMSPVIAASRKLLYSASMTVLRIGESTVECTNNHPVFVKGRGYVKAESVNKGDMLCVRGRLPRAASALPGAQENVLAEVQVLDLLDENGSNEQVVCVGPDEGAESYARRRDASQDVRNTPGDRAQALDSGREWLRAISVRSFGARSAWGGVVAKSCSSDGRAAWKWLPAGLQTGRGEPCTEDLGRSGRQESHGFERQGQGREEDSILAWARVEDVSSVERGCEEGLAVYDLEVAGTHTYFANGVLVHNCHHYVATSYRKPLDFFKDAKILGVTATPDRGDAKALGKIFDDVAYTMDILSGINAGYLAPIVGREVTIQEVNLDNVSTKAGDLAAGELDEAMLKGVEGVVSGMLHHSGDKQGVLFLPGVKSAHLAAARLNAQREGCAVAVDGETDPDTRKQIVADFKAGRFQFLSNCMIATEGFDAPAAAVVGLARPTKSRALYAQMVGRGTRVLPGLVEHIPGAEGSEARRAAVAGSSKPCCKVLDFVGLNTKHTLMTPQDLLGGNHDEATKKKAKELGEKPENANVDVVTLLEMSHAELTRIARSVRSKVKSSSRDFDPFSAFGVSREADQKYSLEYGHKAMSMGQRGFLEKAGFKAEELEKISKRAASQLIDKVIRRRQENLATRNQLAHLHKFGITDPKLDFRVANAAIDYITAQQWGKTVNPSVLRDIVTAKPEELL